MRIVIISSGGNPIPAVKGGATQTMMTHLLDVNEEYGNFKFDVINIYDKEAQQEGLKYSNSRFYFYQRRKFDNLYSLFFRAFRKLTRGKTYLRSRYVEYAINVIKEVNPDIVLVEGNYFQISQLRKAFPKKKIILHIHIDGLYKGFDQAEKILHDSTGIITISEFCKNRVKEIDPSQASKITVLKNTIDVNHFIPVTEYERINIRRKLGIEASKKIIMYCGRLDKNKGILELMKAFVALDDNNTVLMIVGSSAYAGSADDTFAKYIKKFAEKYSDRIVFTGYIPQKDLPQYYGVSDIFSLPSLCNEAAGNVTIEALACQIPVITTCQGGIPEYADTKACIRVSVTDNYVSDLGKALRLLLTDESMYIKLKSNARSVAVKYDKYNYYKHFNKLMHFYDKI